MLTITRTQKFRPITRSLTCKLLLLGSLTHSPLTTWCANWIPPCSWPVVSVSKWPIKRVYTWHFHIDKAWYGPLNLSHCPTAPSKLCPLDTVPAASERTNQIPPSRFCWSSPRLLPKSRSMSNQSVTALNMDQAKLGTDRSILPREEVKVAEKTRQ